MEPIPENKSQFLSYPRIWNERKCSRLQERDGLSVRTGSARGRPWLHPTWLVVVSVVQQQDVSTITRTAVNSQGNFLMTEPAGSLGSEETDRPWSCLSSNFQEEGTLNKVDTNILTTKMMLPVIRWGEVVSWHQLCPNFLWINTHPPTSLSLLTSQVH